MGMFDYLKCQAPLPVEGFEERVWQSKDTPEQGLETYIIDRDGRLLWKGKRDDGRPWTVQLHEFVGVIEFHGFKHEPDTGRERGWLSFVATFVDGVLHRPIELFVDEDVIPSIEEDIMGVLDQAKLAMGKKSWALARMIPEGATAVKAEGRAGGWVLVFDTPDGDVEVNVGDMMRTISLANKLTVMIKRGS